MDIEYKGQVHSFPDDWSQQKISDALSSYKPPPEPALAVNPGFARQILEAAPQLGQPLGGIFGGIPKEAAKLPTPTDVKPAYSNYFDQSVIGGAAEGVKDAAQLPGDVTSGRVDPESEKGVGRALFASMLANPVSPGYRMGSRFGTPPIRKTTTEAEAKAATPTPAPSEVKATSDAQYGQFNAEFGQNKVPTTTAPREFAEPTAKVTSAANQFVDQLIPKLESVGVPQHRAPGIYASLDRLRKADDIDNVKNAVQDISKTFREKTSTDWEIGGARVAVGEIKQFLASIEPRGAALLERAGGNKAAYERYREIVEVPQELAGYRRGASGYGGNPNTLRQVLRPIMDDYARGVKHGMKPDEAAALAQVVEGSAPANLARDAGQFSPGKGAMQTATMIGTGIATGGIGVPAAMAATGVLGNKLAGQIVEKDLNHLGELLLKRSPLYKEAIEKAVKKYEVAADNFLGQPSRSTFVPLLIATRALSGGLIRDGVPVSSGALLRAIRGPVKAPADEDQQVP